MSGRDPHDPTAAAEVPAFRRRSGGPAGARAPRAASGALLCLGVFLAQLASLPTHEWQAASRVAAAADTGIPGPGLPGGAHHDESACALCKSLAHTRALVAPARQAAPPEPPAAEGLLRQGAEPTPPASPSSATAPRGPPIAS